MRTIRAILQGGNCDGLKSHPFRDQQVIYAGGSTYVRTDRRDAENRQVFQAVHNRTLKGLRPCDLG